MKLSLMGDDRLAKSVVSFFEGIGRLFSSMADYWAAKKIPLTEPPPALNDTEKSELERLKKEIYLRQFRLKSIELTAAIDEAQSRSVLAKRRTSSHPHYKNQNSRQQQQEGKVVGLKTPHSKDEGKMKDEPFNGIKNLDKAVQQQKSN